MTVVQLIGHDASNVSEANWEAVFGGLFEGPFAGVANECEVIASAPAAMTVEVRTGTLVSGGVFGQVTAQDLLTIAASDPADPRIDRIVARRTNATDTFELAVLTGTPAGSPTAPALTRAGGVYEISLAQIAVGAAVVQIDTADISDERFNRSVCGFASGAGNSPRVEILDRDLSQTENVSNGGAFGHYSHVIPSGALGADGGLRLTISGDYLNDTGVDRTLLVAVTFGGVNVLAAGAVTLPTSGNRRKWRLEVTMMNSATGAQKWSAVFTISSAGSTAFSMTAPTGTNDGRGTGYDASSVDTTLAKTLAFLTTHSVANASLSCRKETAVLELLPAS